MVKLPDAQSRPGQGGSEKKKKASAADFNSILEQPADDVTEEDIQEYLAGLRRRRAAALRLPPLPDGRRDPWVRVA